MPSRIFLYEGMIEEYATVTHFNTLNYVSNTVEDRVEGIHVFND